MRAMVLEAVRRPLQVQQRDRPTPGPGQVLLKVRACAVCRTDLHVVDGDLPEPTLPLVPGHQIVGEVVEAPFSGGLSVGDRVGVPWLGHTCGTCQDCVSGQENLCPEARFTGYQRDGGFAEYCVADEAFCLRLPDAMEDAAAAPLLCAGLIGYRALRKAGSGRRLGFYGFGAAAHVLTQVAVHQGREVFAFTRPGDEAGQAFARDKGAVWAGGSLDAPPEPLDAAILFAPVGDLVPQALGRVRPGGRVVCAGIHMSDIPSFPYRLLWGERSLVSVANLTRKDGEEFLALAAQVPVCTDVTTYPLEEAGRALEDLRHGRFRGSAVLVP